MRLDQVFTAAAAWLVAGFPPGRPAVFVDRPGIGATLPHIVLRPTATGTPARGGGLGSRDVRSVLIAMTSVGRAREDALWADWMALGVLQGTEPAWVTPGGIWVAEGHTVSVDGPVVECRREIRLSVPAS